MTAQDDITLWNAIVTRVEEEWQKLPAEEKAWAVGHLRDLIRLQEQLHALFLAVGGAESCRACDGECCGHGRFHPTLVNLLACLLTGHPVPRPDFARLCPYIDVSGCQFPPGLRPYNCISFLCEAVEDQLDPEAKGAFYRLEGEIRTLYELFAARYTGAGLRGLLIRGQLLPSYLARR